MSAGNFLHFVATALEPSMPCIYRPTNKWLLNQLANCHDHPRGNHAFPGFYGA